MAGVADRRPEPVGEQPVPRQCDPALDDDVAAVGFLNDLLVFSEAVIT